MFVLNLAAMHNAFEITGLFQREVVEGVLSVDLIVISKTLCLLTAIIKGLRGRRDGRDSGKYEIVQSLR